MRTGTNHSNSSLSEGTYTAELTYYYDSSDDIPDRPAPETPRFALEAGDL